jgi:hypothetical protein
MKTPEEILEELELICKGSLGAHLFVGFEDSSVVLDVYQTTEVLPDGRVVYEINPKFLSLLREAVVNGGVPIGWYRLNAKTKEGGIVELGPLEDHQNEPWVYKYLTHFFGKKESNDGCKYFLVYPDGRLLDITEVE